MADLDIDLILDRAVRLARLEQNGFRSFIAPTLADALRQIKGLINEAGEITSQRQLQGIQAEIRRIINSEQGWTELTNELLDLGMLENEFMAEVLDMASDAAEEALVERLANNTMMVLRSGERFNSGFWDDFIKANLGSQASAVSNIARTGYARGLTARQMVKQVEALFDGMITQRAMALAQTGYAHFSTVGRRAFAEANKDAIAREVPIITFDSRTSDTCISIGARYGQKGWPVGESPIGVPPYHFNCRTTLVYLPPKTNLSGARATQKGQVSASTTINQWFKANLSIAREALGEERFKLWQDGKLSLKDLTSANLQPLTLDELRG
jgi:hypothetical protein